MKPLNHNNMLFPPQNGSLHHSHLPLHGHHSSQSGHLPSHLHLPHTALPHLHPPHPSHHSSHSTHASTHPSHLSHHPSSSHHPTLPPLTQSPQSRPGPIPSGRPSIPSTPPASPLHLRTHSAGGRTPVPHSPVIPSTPSTPGTPGTPGTPSGSSKLSEYMNRPKPKRASRMVFDIVDFLKKSPESVYTWHQLCSQFGQDYPPDVLDHVLDLLKKNPKVDIFPDGRLAYKTHQLIQPKYDAKTKEDVLELLKSNQNGIDLRELLDAYKEVGDDVKALQDEKLVFVLKNAETQTEVVYLNDQTLPTLQIAEIFKNHWNGVSIPDVVELEREMVAAKLKVAPEGYRPIKRQPEKKEPKKRKQKRIKFHNTHAMSDGISVVDDD